ncbi:MAG: ABC transporter permease [Chloroflexi bacterium]|nr:ABC transporter permease [Chloroflexota bacterium]
MSTNTPDASVVTVSGGRSQSRLRSVFANVSTEAMLVIFLVLVVAFFTTQSEYFLSLNNARNVLLAVSVLSVLAFPSTMLIISGNFDLSVASNAAFCGMVFAVYTDGGTENLYVGILLALIAGIIVGSLNGFLVNIVRVNSLITTLGTLAIFRGVAKILSNGQTIRVQGFRFMGEGQFLGIPLPVWIILFVALILAFVMRYIVYGRNLYAIGANLTAARLSGIRNRFTIFATFVLTGFLAGVAGLMLTSQLTAASPIAGLGLELSVVSAVILGGASLYGGRGTIIGTFLGVLILGTVNNGMTLSGLSSFWQEVARGSILIAAVAFDQLRITMGGK